MALASKAAVEENTNIVVYVAADVDVVLWRL
jgi:hypothetical protein